jgi:hypothetical protein
MSDNDLPIDLSQEILENAAGPRSATVSGNSAQQHSIPDQIAADRYAKTLASMKRGGPGFKRFKMRPPGAVDADLDR